MHSTSYYSKCLLQGSTFATEDYVITQKRWYPLIKLNDIVTQKLPVWILNLR